MQNNKGISLVGISNVKIIEQVCRQYPDAVFELSYLSTKEELKEVLPIIKDRIVSMHLLCPVRQYHPNLASAKTFEWSFNQILKDAEFAATFGIKNLILHPGYVMDEFVPTDSLKRFERLSKTGLDQYVQNKTGSICTPDYIKCKRYSDSFKIMQENALKTNEAVAEFGRNLLLENLNPRAGYILMHPDEMIYLAKEGLQLNLDIGHLQTASILFGFDLYEATEKIMSTGKVLSMHLHSNESCSGVYVDSHHSFDKFIDYKRIIQLAETAGSNMIIETLEEPIHNIGLLFDKSNIH